MFDASSEENMHCSKRRFIQVTATPKKLLDHPILFRRIGRDELLLQAIVATGVPGPPTLEDQAVVALKHRDPIGKSVLNRCDKKGAGGLC
jgi:hypothetical protein